MNPENLLLETHGKVALIRLNRPKQLNALNDALMDELGDLLFAIANLARHLAVDPEAALRRTNGKFERRFRRIEALLAESGRTPADASLDELETLWQQAKREERGG